MGSTAHGNLSDHTVIARGPATTIAGTSAVNGPTIDMQGAQGVRFAVLFGTSALDNGIKAQEGDQSDLSDAADLAGSSTLLEATKTLAVLDINRPTKRYIRVVALRGTSTTVDGGTADKYGLATHAAVSAGATVKKLQGPAAGTA